MNLGDQGHQDREEQGRRAGELDRRERQAAEKQAEKVLVAVGRAPRTDDIGLDKTKIKPDRGFIMTNEWMETTEPGDLRHRRHRRRDAAVGACRERWLGWWWRRRMAGKFAKPINKTRIPGCTYCDPQIASVGLTEAQAKEKGFQVKVGKFPFVGNSKATILDAHDGFVKVVADAKYGEVLGVHIIGPYATEIIAEAVTALELEATVEEMMFTIHAHPDGGRGAAGWLQQRGRQSGECVRASHIH